MRHGRVIGLAWAAWAAAAWAQPQMTPEMKALYDKMEEVRRTVRDPLREQMDQRRQVLEKEADLNALRSTLEAAQKAYEMRTETDATLVAARKAAEAAEKALPQLIEARLANHPTLQAIQKDLDAVRALQPQLMNQTQEVRRQLHEVEREVGASAEVEPYRKASEAAETAYYAVSRTDPRFIAARKAMEDAQQALDARIRELPEKKALDEANRAYEELQRTCAELLAARRARDQAREAYQQRLEQLVRHNAKGAEAYRRLGEIDQQQEEAQAQRQAFTQDLFDARREVEKSDPEIAQARQAAEQARQRLKQAIAERAQAEQKAVEDARAALDRQLQEKVAGDFLMKDLKDRYEKANKEIMALYQQTQDLRRRERGGGGEREE